MTYPRLVTTDDHPKVTVRVPAKVNVQLSIGPLRSDGYHTVVNVFQAVSLYDEVTVTATASGGITLDVDGTGAHGVPVDNTNLAWRAALLVAGPTREPHVHISIRKRIAVAAGMAGGSADAAATLVACDALWGTELDRETLDDYAARLGSDVPFALHGGTAIGTGRGDQLTPVLARGQFHWLIGTARDGLSTADVYAELDRLRGDAEVGEPQVDEAVMAALRAGDARRLGAELTNDLQPAALSLRPGLQLALDAGVRVGAIAAMISGSGPTCAFLMSDEANASRCAPQLEGLGVFAGVHQVHGPVAGARIVDGSGTH